MLTAGIWTTVIRTWLLLCRSSVRTDEVNPFTACLAPQYADCNGMERSPSAEPTCTMVPRSRGSMRASAVLRAVHEAEVGHLGDAPELLRGDLVEGREHRGEGDVDPYVDRPECRLGGVGGLLDLVGVGDVDGEREGAPAELLDFRRGRVEPGFAAGEQGDAGAAPGEQTGGGAADAGARSGDDDGLGHGVPFGTRTAVVRPRAASREGLVPRGFQPVRGSATAVFRRQVRGPGRRRLRARCGRPAGSKAPSKQQGLDADVVVEPLQVAQVGHGGCGGARAACGAQCPEIVQAERLGQGGCAQPDGEAAAAGGVRLEAVHRAGPQHVPEVGQGVAVLPGGHVRRRSRT